MCECGDRLARVKFELDRQWGNGEINRAVLNEILGDGCDKNKPTT